MKISRETLDKAREMRLTRASNQNEKSCKKVGHDFLTKNNILFSNYERKLDELGVEGEEK